MPGLWRITCSPRNRQGGNDMNMQEYIQEGESALLHTYNRYQVVLDRGEGVYLYDTDGIKYLDFASGIGVFALGYNNKAYNDALKGWHRDEATAQAQTATKRREVLWMNFEPAGQQKLF